MAKNGNLFGDIGAELLKRAQGTSQQPAAPATVATPTEQQAASAPVASVAVVEPVVQPTAKVAQVEPVEAPVAEPSATLQGKLAKKEKTKKKNYNYGTKHTFPIPDELWGDAVLLMQAQGLSQVDFIQTLIKNAVAENRSAIEAVKKMRSTL